MTLFGALDASKPGSMGLRAATNAARSLCVARHNPPRKYVFYHVGPITGAGRFIACRNIDEVLDVLGHDVSDGWQPA